MKIKSWLVIVVIVGMILSGCGGETATVSPTSAVAPTGGASSPVGPTAVATNPVDLDFWFALSGDSGKAVQELVDRFNASQTGIKVTATYQGDYASAYAKILAAITGSSAPDVVQLGAAPLLGSSEAILPITDFTKADSSFNLDSILPAFLEYNTANGTLWSMPFNNSLPVLYYNKDLFSAAGLDPEAPPQDLNELLADAQKLTLDPGKTGTPSQWGLNFRSDTQWYISTLFLENGGQIVNADQTQVIYNSPESVSMLQLWGDWVNKYMIMPINQHDEAQSDFLAGKLAMFVGSSALVTGLKSSAAFNMGVAMFPMIGSVRKAPVGGGSLAIFSNKDPLVVQASWEFVKYMVSKDSEIYLSTMTGYIPIYKDALTWPEITALMTTDPTRSAAIQELDFAVAIPEFSALGESDAALRTAIQKVELKAATPQQALDDAVQSVNQAIIRLGP